MKIDYEHAANPHTTQGPAAAFHKIFSGKMPESILDVGCGPGTWLLAAIKAGIKVVLGLDGVPIPAERLLIPADRFICQDLTKPIDLGRRFDVCLCLEVGEHILSESSVVLIETLTKHSDVVVFSAACPKQPGQHHVNCRWPDYWQSLFNAQGFICEDSLRAKLWDDPEIEYWYKQNMFLARRDSKAGTESRIKAIISPEMQNVLEKEPLTFEENVTQIEHGRMPLGWYIKTPPVAVYRKISNRLFREDI